MKIKLNIPTDINDITLWQYQEYSSVINDEMTEHEKSTIMVSVFCGIHKDYVNRLKRDKFIQITNEINSLFKRKDNLQQRIKLNGVDYGFIPNLDDISIGEYIDLTNYMGKTEHLNKLMAILYRPITREIKHLYEIEDYEGSSKYSEVMKDLPLGIVLGSQGFFFHLLNDLLKFTKHSLDNKTTVLVQNLTLGGNGDGINLYTL